MKKPPTTSVGVSHLTRKCKIFHVEHLKCLCNSAWKSSLLLEQSWGTGTHKPLLESAWVVRQGTTYLFATIPPENAHRMKIGISLKMWPLLCFFMYLIICGGLTGLICIILLWSTRDLLFLCQKWIGNHIWIFSCLSYKGKSKCFLFVF